MSEASFAPVRRAGLFFGIMGVAVAALTYGAGIQGFDDTSSSSVAQAKVERHVPVDALFAAVNPSDRARSSAQRAVSPDRQAQAAVDAGSVLR